MSSDKKTAKRPTRIKDLKSKKTAAAKAEHVKGGKLPGKRNPPTIY